MTTTILLKRLLFKKIKQEKRNRKINLMQIRKQKEKRNNLSRTPMARMRVTTKTAKAAVTST